MPQDLFAQFPHLTSDTLILRQITPDDLEALFAIYSDDRLFRYTPGHARKNKATVQNMIGHFARDFRKRKTIFMGICLTASPGQIVGIAEVYNYQRAANIVEIGYRLHAGYWGRGIATHAVAMLAEYLLCTIGINRIQAFVMPENQKSHAVLLRNGFQKEGLIRQGFLWTGKGVIDLIEYSLLRSDYGC